MIEYSIRKKKPSLLHRITGGVFEIGNPQKNTQQQYPVVPVEPILGPLGGCYMEESDYDAATRFMDKHFYNAWLNEVQTRFKKGDLLTLRMYPIIPQRTNTPFFYIVDTFQEMRHLAQWDSGHKQPRAIGLRPGVSKEAIYLFASPGMTRKLTKEEEELVHLQHPQIKDEIRELRGEAPGAESTEGYSG